MSLAVLGIVVLGSLLFIVYTVVNFLEESSPLKAEIEETIASTEAKRKKIEDYQRKIETLREVGPDIDRRTRRLERWIDLLKEQLAHVKTQEMRKADIEREKRDAAVKAGIASKWAGV